MAEEKKKLTTAEILAQARAQAKGASGESPSAETPATPAEPTPSVPETPAPAAQSAPAAPKSTSDILAAARAQAGGKPSAAAPQKPAAGGAPKSTSDILAAARAQAGKGAPVTEDSPAPAKAKPKATAPASGELPPVQEMIKAVTGEKAPAAPAAPQRMPVPQKPPAPRAKAEEVPRRNVLLALVATPLALAWTLLAATTGWFTLYVARFMMPNYLIEPPSKFKIGPPSDYGFGTVSTKWTSQFGVWIVHTEYNGKKEIYALASVCTHLGCTPNWLEGEQKFKCPCHGSGFYINGVNFEGPAPRPLERVGLRLGVDGLLEVDKSVKFQEELGQWNDDASFVVV